MVGCLRCLFLMAMFNALHTRSAVIRLLTPAVNPVYINLGDFDYAA